MTTLDEIIQTLTEKSAGIEPFGKKIKFVLDGNIVVINGCTQPPSIETTSDAGQNADVTATTSLENFGKIINKKINVQMAMMTGKIKIQGDMLAAVPLMKLL